jgi:hypothetical protein
MSARKDSKSNKNWWALTYCKGRETNNQPSEKNNQRSSWMGQCPLPLRQWCHGPMSPWCWWGYYQEVWPLVQFHVARLHSCSNLVSLCRYLHDYSPYLIQCWQLVICRVLTFPRFQVPYCTLWRANPNAPGGGQLTACCNPELSSVRQKWVGTTLKATQHQHQRRTLHTKRQRMTSDSRQVLLDGLRVGDFSLGGKKGGLGHSIAITFQSPPCCTTIAHLVLSSESW